MDDNRATQNRMKGFDKVIKGLFERGKWEFGTRVISFSHFQTFIMLRESDLVVAVRKAHL